jgi:hypothetical protein
MVMVMVMVGVLSENRHKKLSCDRTLNILAYYTIGIVPYISRLQYGTGRLAHHGSKFFRRNSRVAPSNPEN